MKICVCNLTPKGILINNSMVPKIFDYTAAVHFGNSGRSDYFRGRRGIPRNTDPCEFKNPNYKLNSTKTCMPLDVWNWGVIVYKMYFDRDPEFLEIP